MVAGSAAIGIPTQQGIDLVAEPGRESLKQGASGIRAGTGSQRRRGSQRSQKSANRKIAAFPFQGSALGRSRTLLAMLDARRKDRLPYGTRIGGTGQPPVGFGLAERRWIPRRRGGRPESPIDSGGTEPGLELAAGLGEGRRRPNQTCAGQRGLELDRCSAASVRATASPLPRPDRGSARKGPRARWLDRRT